MDAREDVAWWTAETDAHRAAWSVAEQLRTAQRSSLAEDAADFLSLYDPRTTADRGTSVPGGFVALPYDPELATFNAIQAVVDTMVSQLVKNKVRPFFLTDGGDADLREKAEGMNQAVEGIWTEAGVYGALGRYFALDGMVFGDGYLKAYPDYPNKRITVERVHKWDLFVSEREARSGFPRQLHHVYAVDRALLLGLYPDHEKEILDAEAATTEDYEAHELGAVADMVLVCESWHLPSGRVDLDDEDAWQLGTHDGRHIVTIGASHVDAPLLDEAWPYSYFPIASFKPKVKNLGFRGRGAPETLLGIQLAINRLSKRIDRILHLHGRPIIEIARGAKYNKDHISNATDLVIETNAPGGLRYVTPNSVPAELLQREMKLIEQAFEQWGVSQMSAASKKPAGLESGVAIRTVLDTESVRHSDTFMGWEGAFIDLARITVDAIRMLAEHVDDFEIMWGDDKELRRVKWTDVDMPEAKYRLRAWPTNLFSQTPGAKKDEILEMLRYKLFDPEMALQALEYPDVRQLYGNRRAALENVERIIDRIVREGKDHVAHPYLNLPLARNLAVAKLNELEAMDKLDDPNTEKLRNWVEQIDRLMQPPPAPMGAPAGAAPPPGGPPGRPLPAPGGPPAPPMPMAPGGPMPPPGAMPMPNAA